MLRSHECKKDGKDNTYWALVEAVLPPEGARPPDGPAADHAVLWRLVLAGVQLETGLVRKQGLQVACGSNYLP